MEKLLGPHEGIELRLMLAGEKPCAMINHNKWNFDWMIAGCKNGWHLTIGYDLIKKPFVVVFKDGEDWRASQIVKTYERINKTGNFTDTDHAKLGIALGYPKHAIRAFLDAKTS